VKYSDRLYIHKFEDIMGKQVENEVFTEQPITTAPEQREEYWFKNDPIYNLCLHLSYLNTAQEAFGSIAMQIINNQHIITGIGWNMNVAGESFTKKRQGYSNHAEFQSLQLAEELGYDMSNPNIPTYIFSAGRIVQEDTLFLHPVDYPFTCPKCVKSLSEANPNIYIITPSSDGVWLKTTIADARRSSKRYKDERVSRYDTMSEYISCSDIDISLTQDKMDRIVKDLEDNGIVIDPVIKEVFLQHYEELLNLSPRKRRKIWEDVVCSNNSF